MYLTSIRKIPWREEPDICFCCKVKPGMYLVGLQDRCLPIKAVVCHECKSLEPAEIVAMMEGGIIND